MEKLQSTARVWFLYWMIVVIEWDHCECWTSCFWPDFSRSNFSNRIISECLAKNAPYGFHRFWYFPLNGAIPVVVLWDISQFFQGQIFQILMSRKRWELRKYVKYDFYARWHFPSKSNHCENHTVRPWLAISGSKVQVFTNIFQQICLHLHRRWGGEVVLFLHISIERYDLCAFCNDNLKYVLLKLDVDLWLINNWYEFID